MVARSRGQGTETSPLAVKPPLEEQMSPHCGHVDPRSGGGLT